MTRVPVRICSITGCDNKQSKRGMCNMHYLRVKRNGSPERQPYVKPKCSILDCNEEHRARGYCMKHHLRLLRYGDANAYFKVSGERHHYWAGDDVGYYGMHARIKHQRGRAADFDCQDCGTQAVHWSYNNTGVDEQVDQDGMRYSTDVEQYSPRCVSCHSAFDNQTNMTT